MKKLFYIVLIVVALMVISRFVKQSYQAPAVDNTAVVTTNADGNLVKCKCEVADCPCAQDDTNCACGEQKENCACKTASGETVNVEETIEDVVEINPEETQHEDETIINDEASTSNEEETIVNEDIAVKE